MYAAPMIRDLTFDQLKRALRSVRNILDSSDPEALTRYRDGGSGWTVTEVLCHLRDFESVFLQRARLTAVKDFPDLPFPDPDRLALDHDYAHENLCLVCAPCVPSLPPVTRSIRRAKFALVSQKFHAAYGHCLQRERLPLRW